MLTKDSSISIYGSDIWNLIPSQWRHWWLDEGKEIECCSGVTLDSPKPYFVEFSLYIGSFEV